MGLSKNSLIRLIPAHAGSTPLLLISSQLRWAHPRSRGEHGGSGSGWGHGFGSSPLTRGARALLPLGASLLRLIPAHAGSTGYIDAGRQLTAAHPRSRGEHRADLDAKKPEPGSSPLTRGARGGAIPRCASVGLIPAHAGSTTSATWLTRTRWAHPRSRGEHSLPWLRYGTVRGSSPLTRGALESPTSRGTLSGLIPAHAGSTAAPQIRPAKSGAHPRSRGEHGLIVKQHNPLTGSSPLTRGAPTPSTSLATSSGLIPAHAGSTLTEQRIKEPFPQFTYGFSEETVNLSRVAQLFSFLFLICRTKSSGL